MSPASGPSRRNRLILLALFLVAIIVLCVFLGPRVAYEARKAMRPPQTAVVPREASVMFNLDMDRLRDTKMWTWFLDFMKSNSDADAAFQNLAKGTGFNPLEEVDTVVGAYPRLDLGTDGFGLVMYGRSLKPDRLEAWSRGELQKDNKVLLSRDYKGHKLIWDSGKPSLLVTFYRNGTVLIGSDKWIEEMIDLQAEPAKAPPVDVAPLLAKVKRDWVFWGAGPVPGFVRDKLRANGSFPTAATITAAYLSVDFETGLTVAGGALLGSDGDAIALVTQLRSLQDVIRGSEQVQNAGLVPYVDAIHFEAKGPEVTVDINLPQARLDDLAERMKALLSRPPTPIPSELPLQPKERPSLSPDAGTPLHGPSGSRPSKPSSPQAPAR